MRNFSDLTEREILALAIANEEEDGRIYLANGAAENFFQASSSVLMRHKLSDLVQFSSPVLSAVAQARTTAGIFGSTHMAEHFGPAVCCHGVGVQNSIPPRSRGREAA